MCDIHIVTARGNHRRKPGDGRSGNDRQRPADASRVDLGRTSNEAAMSDDEPKQDAPKLERGDCVAEHLGEIELKDGRRFRGLILTFPAGPPSIPMNAVWDRLPMRLTLKE
jgi:hypothetical protein